MVRNPSLRKIIRLLQNSLTSPSDPDTADAPLLTDQKRRQFLKLSAQTAAILPFSAWMAKQALAGLFTETARDSATSSPVIILGGGVSGLVAAYRLSQAKIPCVLYEASERFGGRMYTHSGFNSDGMFCELGGELVDTDHLDLIQLCAELGVGIQELDAGDTGFQTQLFYANGSLRGEKEMLEAYRPLAAHISQDLSVLFGTGGVRVPTYRDAADPVMVKFDQMTLADYLDSKTDVEKWARDLLGILYLCEFGRELNEQSALNFLTLISADTSVLKPFGDSDECKRIQGGSSSLPDALIKAMEGRVTLYANHPLVKIRDDGTRLWLTFKESSAPVEVAAKNVICTIPFSILRDIEGIEQLSLNPILLNCIKNLGYGSNAKMMTGFKRRVWRDPEINSNGAVVTIAQHQFWETSRLQSGQSGVITQFMGGNFSKQIPLNHLHASLRELDLIFPGTQEAYDGNLILQHWPSHVWNKGSYTCPLPGQYTSIFGIAAEPALSGRLLFAGEHTSIDSCGLMNGAVQSGNLAVKSLIENSVRGVATGVASVPQMEALAV